MTNLVGRTPKIALFATAALIQVSLIAAMVVDRASILRTGTDVMLQTRPVDPRDFLRGDYVTLAYDISTIPAGTLKLQSVAQTGTTVFVKLVPNRGGFYEAVSVDPQPVAVTSPEVLIRGRVAGGMSCGADYRAFCETLEVRYNIEQYFVPEGEGANLENARNQHKLAVVAAVAPDGRAAIRRLLIDGTPIYEEPWF